MPRTDRSHAHPRSRHRRAALVVSCEHGGNRVPSRYRSLFARGQRTLDSHRGWDPGALELARAISRACRAPLVATTTTRLLVECNRSLDHPQLFSEFTRGLDAVERGRIVRRYYLPHRLAVTGSILGALCRHGRVVHIGVHTFTPVWRGRRRAVDVGVLYDPRRPAEVMVGDLLVGHLKHFVPGLRVHRNRPYSGRTDGLTTTLRSSLPASRYAGIEIEVNQALALGGRPRWRSTRQAIAMAILGTIRDL
jgi:predicted N-formylglutamate amidohydrolase